jgi:hypothetical protein
MPENVSRHAPTLSGRCLLVKPKMNPAVDARVVEVIGNLLKTRVLQPDVGHRRIGHLDVVRTHTVDPLE